MELDHWSTHISSLASLVQMICTKKYRAMEKELLDLLVNDVKVPFWLLCVN